MINFITRFFFKQLKNYIEEMYINKNKKIKIKFAEYDVWWLIWYC